MDGKSGYVFLSGEVTRSSLILYREYCIQDGNLDACSVANIPRGILGTRENPDTCRIHVDEQVLFQYGYVCVDAENFESGKKNLRMKKNPDTCGRGLRLDFEM